MTQSYQGVSVYRRREVKEVGVDVELAFCEIIVATWRRGLDWTGHYSVQEQPQSLAALVSVYGRFAGEPDWEIPSRHFKQSSVPAGLDGPSCLLSEPYKHPGVNFPGFPGVFAKSLDIKVISSKYVNATKNSKDPVSLVSLAPSLSSTGQARRCQ